MPLTGRNAPNGAHGKRCPCRVEGAEKIHIEGDDKVVENAGDRGKCLLRWADVGYG